MKEHFPPLVEPSSLPRRVLCIAPHPDDEVLGCGGALAMHSARGDAVRVVVLTDGAAGGVPAEVREAESRAAAEVLGVDDVAFLGLPDGALGETFDLAQRIASEVEAFDPELVYAPSLFERHPDHRAAACAAVAALAKGRTRRAMLFGVNVPGVAAAAGASGALLDVTGLASRKAEALACFESQGAGLAERALAADRSRVGDVDVEGVEAAEGFVDLPTDRLLDWRERVDRLREFDPAAGGGAPDAARAADPHAATAVISTWNKVADLCENLDGIRAQTRAFRSVVVVDNDSSDETARTVAERYPEVRLVRMPHSAYGACETFNIGFASATTPLVAILDDDVVLPPEWLERTTERLAREPETTALVSTEVIEPEMPESYRQAIERAPERYMSTFRGCASLARKEPLARAGYYDERLFIYGNERDLTCRLLNQGCRVLHYPSVRAFHKTPFGIKMGKRSLYYHARNAWLTMLKYAPAEDLLRLPWLVVSKVLLRSSDSERSGEVSDATGTIGIGRSVRETPGAWLVLLRAGLSVLANVPYCLARRRPVRAPDFELPLS